MILRLLLVKKCPELDMTRVLNFDAMGRGGGHRWPKLNTTSLFTSTGTLDGGTTHGALPALGCGSASKLGFSEPPLAGLP